MLSCLDARQEAFPKDAFLLRTGDTVELVGPDLRPFSMTVPEMRDETGTVIEEPRNPQMLLKLRLPRPVPPMTLVRHQVELSAK